VKTPRGNPLQKWTVPVGTGRLPFLTLALLTGLAAALAAQEQQPAGKDKKETDDKARDTVARVAKDMQTAEQRLKKTDPGEVTRKIQRDVVDGLDELIKQSGSPQGGSGGGKSSKKQDAGGQPKSGSSKGGRANDKTGRQDKQLGSKDQVDANDMGQQGRAKGGKDGGPQAMKKDQGKGDGKDGKDDKPGAGKEGGKKDDESGGQKGLAKGNEPGKDGGRQGGLASAKNEKSRPNSSLTAETYRADWGHLPLTKRLEMDAYSKERFMPRYDEVLQQYYRTIAEQGQKKDDRTKQTHP
jgi:hypothetical protein